MGALTTAIVQHDLEGIARAIREHPEEVGEPIQGFLPVEWAQMTGNLVTYMRVVRLLGDNADSVNYPRVLAEMLWLMRSANHYYDSGTPEQAAERAWEQVYEGIRHPFHRDGPDFILDEESRKDFDHFIKRAGCPSKQALVALVREFVEQNR